MDYAAIPQEVKRRRLVTTMENYPEVTQRDNIVADDKQENEVVEAETTSNLQEIDKHFDG